MVPAGERRGHRRAARRCAWPTASTARRARRFPTVVPGDVAFLQYTSGSTGSPKGVMLSHEGLLTNIGQLIEGMALTRLGLLRELAARVPRHGSDPDDDGARSISARSWSCCRRRSPTRRPWLVAIARHRGTVTAAPDFAYRLTLRHVREPAAYDLSSLRLALNAAEPVRPSTIEEFERAFGLRHVVIAGYGLAEATVGVSTWTPGTAPLVDARGVVSVGRPFRGIDIQIIEDGQPLAAGRIGEIVVRQPGQHARLLQRSRRRRRACSGATTYIRTGDLGYLDEAGRLFVTGRLKNIIKHGGETIFPQEAEQIVDRLPFVRRSAAIGIDSGGARGRAALRLRGTVQARRPRRVRVPGRGRGGGAGDSRPTRDPPRARLPAPAALHSDHPQRQDPARRASGICTCPATCGRASAILFPSY